MITRSIKGNDFAAWRNAARGLLVAGVPPGEVIWSAEGQGSLFDSGTGASNTSSLHVPRDFVEMAKAVACFDDAAKWDVLYRILFRIVRGERELLEIASDPDVSRAMQMRKAVNRDVHKFHAFVRFREVKCGDDEIFAAWYEPHHFTVERATPFFARRFGAMRFSIFTPKGCAHWDREKLVFSEPADRSMAPREDELEGLWLLYYRSIFNPFRLKVSAMTREFPKRHWPTLPEAVLIPELIRDARHADDETAK